MASDVVGFEVRKGSDRFRFTEQVRITPAPSGCGMNRAFVRCWSRGRGKSVITDIERGSLVVDHKAVYGVIHRIWLHPNAVCLGYTKRGRIGDPSELFFLEPSSGRARQLELPDAVSEVVPGGGPEWYLGCRNGVLYRFSTDGQMRWQWNLPLSKGRDFSSDFSQFRSYTHNPFLRVAAAFDHVVVAEGNRLYQISFYGETQWEREIPSRVGAEISFPSGDFPTRQEMLDKLALPPSSFSGPLGYFRLALDPTSGVGGKQATFAAEGFCEVDQFEPSHLEPNVTSADDVVSVELSLGGGFIGEHISAVAAAENRTMVGVSDGGMYVFDRLGNLRKTFRLGTTPVSAILLDEGHLRAAFNGGRLTLFDANRITGAVDLPEYFAEIVNLGPHVLVRGHAAAWVVNSSGTVIWQAIFSRQIRGVVVDDFGFWVLAGPLYCFRRTEL